MSKIRLFFQVVLVVFLTSCTSKELEFEDSSTNELVNEFYFVEVDNIETKPIESEILDLINLHRVSIGLNALLLDSESKIQAYQHSAYMANESQISHDFFFQRDTNLRNLTNAKSVSENVGFGYNSANSLVQAWLNSESHKAVIESVVFTHFNVVSISNSDGELFFTLMCIQK